MEQLLNKLKAEHVDGIVLDLHAAAASVALLASPKFVVDLRCGYLESGRDAPTGQLGMDPTEFRLKNTPKAGDKIVGGKIPKEYIPAVDNGIKEAMDSGVLAGYPIVDVAIELVDGSYHEVDSSERAFKIAGSMAFKEAMNRS